MSFRTTLVPGAVALAVIFSTACSDAVTSLPLSTAPSGASFSKGSGGGGGGGGGGGVDTTPPVPSNLPTTAPAPGVLLRESFGLANLMRPKGDKGLMTDLGIHTTIAGYWLEYPGSKDTRWLVPQSGQTWKFASCSDDPFEMPSPIQTPFSGCVASEWFDAVTSYPTALMPFTPPAGGYELSMDGYPAPIANAYVAIGFTGSSVLTSNLTTFGSLWLRVRDLRENGMLNYELRTNGMNGPVLASGNIPQLGFNRLALRYDPSTSTATLTLQGEAIGSYAVTIAPPRYVAFEGVGILDNFVVRE